jgi:hypothetical protein
VANGELTVTWPAWSGEFGRYVVLRTISRDSTREPDTPTTDGIGGESEAASLARADQVSYVQPLNGTNGVPFDTPYVAYRVAVVSPSGEVVGLSQTLILRLRWKTLGGSGEIDPVPTTTTVVPLPESANRSR